MNEIFDKLLIRFLFTVFICVVLVLYKYAHTIFYPSARKQIFKRIYPSENPADTLHLFARIIGISLILSILDFNEYTGILVSSLHFFTWGIISFICYLISLYITETIIFPNFHYVDEVLKKQNMSYAIISFTNAICLAYLIRTVIQESEFSFILLAILWLLVMVQYGLALKLFKVVSELKFHKLLIQKNLGLGFSFAGFLLGITIILVSAFSHEHHDIASFIIQILLKVLLAALIVPLFRIGINFIFKIEKEDIKSASTENPTLGFGIYEGAVFLSCGLLTSIIIGRIYFGTIYPIF